MDVNLTPELEAFVQRKVESGLYASQSEVVCAALRRMVEQDRMRTTRVGRLRATLAESVRQADRGELLDGPRLVAASRAALWRRRKAGRPRG